MRNLIRENCGNFINTMLENFLFSILGQSLSICEKEDKIWKNELNFYEDNLLSDSDDGCLQKYHEAKAELDQLYNHITEGIIIHSPIAWYEYGEKSSKYFLGLEKRNKSKTHLKKLLSDDRATELTDPKQIRTELKAFYSNLYRR